MIDETMLKVAEAEVKRLEAELEKTPAYKRLQAAKNLIAVYRGEPEVAADSEAPPAKPARVRAVLTAPLPENEIVPATKTAQVDAAAVEFLINKARRATSGEILPFVQAKGIEITGAVPAKTLASYLSRSKRFDNVQGFGGFGLVEWHGRRGPPASAGTSTTNEIVHDGGKLPLNS
jgi:hypothetical protein